MQTLRLALSRKEPGLARGLSGGTGSSDPFPDTPRITATPATHHAVYVKISTVDRTAPAVMSSPLKAGRRPGFPVPWCSPALHSSFAENSTGVFGGLSRMEQALGKWPCPSLPPVTEPASRSPVPVSPLPPRHSLYQVRGQLLCSGVTSSVVIT